MVTAGTMCHDEAQIARALHDIAAFVDLHAHEMARLRRAYVEIVHAQTDERRDFARSGRAAKLGDARVHALTQRADDVVLKRVTLSACERVNVNG